MSKSKVVFFKDLKPSWGAKGAKEVGFMRWFAHYVSGKPPVSHTNPETGAISEYCKVGVWSLSVGQRQLKHSHIGEEIYVVIRGQIAVENGDGSETVLGPLDCLYNPPKGVHGVRNCGLEDALMVLVLVPLEVPADSVYVE